MMKNELKYGNVEEIAINYYIFYFMVLYGRKLLNVYGGRY